MSLKMQVLVAVVLVVGTSQLVMVNSMAASKSENESNQVKLSYCGAKPRPPYKDLLCREICDDGICRDFYCECPTRPKGEKNCMAAGGRSRKCEDFCAQKANLANSLTCPVASEDNQKYCVCF